MATEHEARVITAARAVARGAIRDGGRVVAYWNQGQSQLEELCTALRALDAGERGAAELDWPQVEQAIKLAEKDAAAIFAHLRVALTAVNGVLEAAAEKEASAGKTTLLRSEVAYLRCVEDAARMVVNAAKYVGVPIANLEGQLKDLDEFRNEFGYWHG